MSSLKQPTSSLGSSRLPQLSRLRPPQNISTQKRRCSDEVASPEKKRKLSDTSTNPLQGLHSRKQMPCPTTRPPQGRLRRSVSMASIVVRNKPSMGLRTGQLRSNAGGIPPTRPSNISADVLRNRANMGSTRKPVANITNINNRMLTKVTENGPAKAKGKPKRAAWDLKGRLVDMEEILKDNSSKLTVYDSRMAALETEKQLLTQDLQQTQTISASTGEEIKLLNKQLLEEISGRSAEKEAAQNEIKNLQLEKKSLETKTKNLDAELFAKTEEAAGLKSSVAQLMSTKAGLEAEYESTKLLLEERTKKLNNVEELAQQQAETLAELRQKVMEGETMRRQLHNTVQELKGNIRVFCRVRPLLKEEIVKNGGSDVISHISFVDEKSLEIIKSGNLDTGLKNRLTNYEFKFDQVFSPQTQQTEIFEELSQLVQSALDGYNVCVFAYGQTGSGKTFTMEGSYDSEGLEGMIPRTVRQIFETTKDLEEKGWSYKIEASFLEIYNETIRDLLATPKEAKNTTYDIKLTDGKTNSQIYVSNLKIIPVDCSSKVYQLLSIAQQHRSVAATNMNERSSRSHSVFRLTLSGYNYKTQEACEGTLNLVDLAGSERLKDSGSEGARLTETQSINKSLANLGNVIMAIAQKQSHVPFRNSKLTHLLQKSLGGNSKTLMFVNVSPTESCFNETLNSLRFATKVNQCHIGTASKQARK